jgi:hypothetical protein
MKFGVREICDVVLKAKGAQKIGNKVFYKHEPVIYFDTLKTSGLEGAATTVYAQGGRGNSRLVAWEGERTVTFTMEDALISPEGFMILSGAGLIEATKERPIYQHIMETTDEIEVTENNELVVYVKEEPYVPDKKEDFAYVMLMVNGEIISEPFIPEHVGKVAKTDKGYPLTVKADEERLRKLLPTDEDKTKYTIDAFGSVESVMVDYYTPKTSGARQIEITPDKFGGNYYLEASTLFRDTNGIDMPAEFIIPNCKIQSNFNFTMASSGDPSTFTFTMDAFPDYTRFDKSKKVLCAIQIIDVAGNSDLERTSTIHADAHNTWFED